MITNITIKNIKGYGDPPKSIDLEIKSNRINLLMAPNGTGKSSIAAAFRSLKPRSLDVAKENKFHKDETLLSELSVTLDGQVLAADAIKNEILHSLSCTVITCNTAVSTTHKNIGGKFAQVSGYLDIADIVIKEKIPADIKPSFRITEIRKEFGTNGKILPNDSVFSTNRHLWLLLDSLSYQLNMFLSAKRRADILKTVISNINALKGTERQIRDNVQDDWFAAIEAEPSFQTIQSTLEEYVKGRSKLDRFIFFYEILRFWQINKSEIKAANEYTEYKDFKSVFDRNLSLLDSTWKNIHTVEKDGKLIVKFPQADEISNGQRDILTFVIELLKFKSSIKNDKKYLLLIDEVFDYIDDANTIAAQYFLTNLLKEHKGNLYLCILTHLNPYTFKNYLFPDKKVNHVYLQGIAPKATPAMQAFISFREGLDKDDANQELLYGKLSHDLFHYNPIVVDYSADITTYRQNRDLDPLWGKTEVLHQKLIEQVNKYMSDNDNYDPYAVALAVRLRVEKLAYNKLNTDEQKKEFVNTLMTKNKFKYCEDAGVELPEILNIANAIHNDADHLKFDAEQDRYIEKPMVYKLQHNVIRTMISKLFECNGHPLASESID